MLTQLSKYMFTNALTISTCPVVARKQQETVTPVKTPSTSPWFVPRFNDTLFWCFYIMRHSLSEYELVSMSGFKEEHAFKIAFVEATRSNPNFVKNHKICRTTLENEMVNEKKITLLGFKALCLFYKIKVVVIHADMFIEIPSEENGSFMVRRTKGKYELLMKASPTYTDKLVKVKTFAKPLSAQASYKLADLERMSTMLGIRWEGKARKRQLYDKLLVRLTRESECPI